MSDKTEQYPTEEMVIEEHAEEVLERENLFRMNKMYCDVILIARDGTRVLAHRPVLSACSEHFQVELEKEQMEFKFDIDGNILIALVDFCYTGKIVLQGMNVEPIMTSAAALSLISLLNVCVNYLVKHLGESNCMKILPFAERCNFSILLEKAKAFVYQHFMEVSKTEEFLQLSFEHLRSIIASDELQVTCEEDVLNCVLSWLQHDWPKRHVYGPKFIQLDLIRLQLLPRPFLVENVHKIYASDPECHNRVREVMKWHSKGQDSSILAPPRTRNRN